MTRLLHQQLLSTTGYLIYQERFKKNTYKVVPKVIHMDTKNCLVGRVRCGIPFPLQRKGNIDWREGRTTFGLLLKLICLWIIKSCTDPALTPSRSGRENQGADAFWRSWVRLFPVSDHRLTPWCLATDCFSWGCSRRRNSLSTLRFVESGSTIFLSLTPPPFPIIFFFFFFTQHSIEPLFLSLNLYFSNFKLVK